MPTVNSETIKKILFRHARNDRSSLVDILHDIQTEFRYLPKEALKAAAEHTGAGESVVYGVASFYSGFHFKPRGRHVCTVCMGTACHVRGSSRLMDQLERDLKIKSGGTTEDMSITVDEVNCVGACALGPLVIVDGRYHGHMSSPGLTKLISDLREKKD